MCMCLFVCCYCCCCVSVACVDVAVCPSLRLPQKQDGTDVEVGSINPLNIVVDVPPPPANP